MCLHSIAWRLDTRMNKELDYTEMGGQSCGIGGVDLCTSYVYT